MKKRILALIAVTIAINVTIGSIYYFGSGGGGVAAEIIGEAYPEGILGIEGITGIETDANEPLIEIEGVAKKMFLVGVRNFEKNAAYAASSQTGEVTGKAGGVDFANDLKSVRIRQGGEVFWRTATLSKPGGSSLADVRVYEEAFTKDKKYFYRKALPKTIEGIDGGIKADFKKGAETQKTYGNFDEYIAEVSTDPARLSMHIFEKETIEQPTAPEYNSEQKFYTYSFTLSQAGVSEYKNVVKGTMGAMKDKIKGDVTFTKIFMRVTQWDNGLIKSIDFEEEYSMTVNMVFDVGITITMKATSYFSYNENEPGYQIREYTW